MIEETGVHQAPNIQSTPEPIHKPSIGRIVHYRLSIDDVSAINRRRIARASEPGWPLGAQAHVGNPVNVGNVFPMMITASNCTPGAQYVNGQVFLDGSDTLWVTSCGMGSADGEFFWPPRV